MVKSDSVHEEAVITINQLREKSEESSSASAGCRRALSCPSTKSRRSRHSFIGQKHQEAGKNCDFLLLNEDKHSGNVFERKNAIDFADEEEDFSRSSQLNSDGEFFN